MIKLNTNLFKLFISFFKKELIKPKCKKAYTIHYKPQQVWRFYLDRFPVMNEGDKSLNLEDF